MTCTKQVLDQMTVFLQKIADDNEAQKKDALEKAIPLFKSALEGAEKADEFTDIVEGM